MRCLGSCWAAAEQPEPDTDFRLLSTRTVKAARKPHTCVRCGQVIPAGTSCLVVTAIWDGAFGSDYQHHPTYPPCDGTA